VSAITTAAGAAPTAVDEREMFLENAVDDPEWRTGSPSILSCHRLQNLAKQTFAIPLNELM
jgi:hypothetical protein